jgi:hypothetical protein
VSMNTENVPPILKKTKVRLTAAGREKLTHKAPSLLEQA